MTKCEVCGKEFKTGQGLGGHMRWVHGIIPDKQHPLFPPKRFITDEQLSEALKTIMDSIIALTERVNANATAGAAAVAELDKMVLGLLTVHYLPGSKIKVESLPARIQSNIRVALATK